MLPDLAEWEGFYVITGSSAAALTGLMFVVITLSAERMPKRMGALPAFATPTIVHFCAVLLLAGLMTTPSHTTRSLAWCFAVVGVAGLAYVTRVTYRIRRQADYTPVTEDHIWHVALPLAAYALPIASAVSLARHHEASLRMAAVFTMGLLFIGIHNAWDAAVWIATHKAEE